jgi:DNA-binding CsgD family transcriptional regulator
MIFALNEENDLCKMRKDFLRTINTLIPHDRSFFDLGYRVNTKVVFFDPVPRNMEEKYLISYYDEYEHLDTMYWFFAQNQNDVYRETDYINEAIRNSSVFYSGWLAPQDIMYSMGSTVAHKGILYGSANLWRSELHGDFSDEEFQIMTILNKHLSLRFYLRFPNGIRKNNRAYADSLAELYRLTPKELEIVYLLYEGHSAQKIGEALFISENTVKKHSHNIFSKMKVSNRLQMLKIVHDHMGGAPGGV